MAWSIWIMIESWVGRGTLLVPSLLSVYGMNGLCHVSVILRVYKCHATVPLGQWKHVQCTKYPCHSVDNDIFTLWQQGKQQAVSHTCGSSDMKTRHHPRVLVAALPTFGKLKVSGWGRETWRCLRSKLVRQSIILARLRVWLVRLMILLAREECFLHLRNLTLNTKSIFGQALATSKL